LPTAISGAEGSVDTPASVTKRNSTFSMSSWTERLDLCRCRRRLGLARGWLDRLKHSPLKVTRERAERELRQASVDFGAAL
jgi:hypothetical protein